MIIGIDGNEANVNRRVGSNIYAYQILKKIWTVNGNKFIVYLKDKPLPDMPSTNKQWKYKVLRPKFLWTKWRLPLELLCNKDKIDIFFTPGHYAPSICPMPLVISIMDLAFLKYPNQFLKKDLIQLRSWTKKSVQKADKILTISKSTKNDIIDYYQVDRGKVKVAYPAISNIKMTKNNEKILKKYNLQKGKYLIFVGTLQPRKNLIRLIKAFSKLIGHQSLAISHLLIVGKKGWMYDEIFEEVKKQKLEDKIIFTGFVSEKEKNSLLKNASAFVLPSLYEGFGFPVLEAMQTGVPVVISNVSSLPEVGGNAALYIEDPKSVDSIYSTLKKAVDLSDSAREELIKKGKEQVKKFSWRKTAEQTLGVIQEVAKN